MRGLIEDGSKNFTRLSFCDFYLRRGLKVMPSQASGVTSASSALETEPRAAAFSITVWRKDCHLLLYRIFIPLN